MNNDIVTRLRGAAAGFRIAVGTNDSFTFPTLHSEAADEIERLREEVKYWKSEADKYKKLYLEGVDLLNEGKGWLMKQQDLIKEMLGEISEKH